MIRVAFYRLLMVICLVVLSIACSNEDRPNAEEQLRLDSPDGRVQAILLSRGYGATVPSVSELYIVQKGRKIEGANLILRADHMTGTAISWKSPKFLEVRYEKARVFQFTNFWQSHDVDNFRYIVEVRLRPPEHAASLP